VQESADQRSGTRLVPPSCRSVRRREACQWAATIHPTRLVGASTAYRLRSRDFREMASRPTPRFPWLPSL